MSFFDFFRRRFGRNKPTTLPPPLDVEVYWMKSVEWTAADAVAFAIAVNKAPSMGVMEDYFDLPPGSYISHKQFSLLPFRLKNKFDGPKPMTIEYNRDYLESMGYDVQNP